MSTDAEKQETRFIPTGVGNTKFWALSDRRDAVHPHGRGEHGRGAIGAVQFTGSSPRAWGTLLPVHLLIASIRFIPTGVGNTSCHPIQL